MYTHLDLCLAQLFMSARAFPITLCPSSTRLAVCRSVRLLNYFSKAISTYSFKLFAFKFYTGVKHEIGYAACAVLTIELFLNFHSIVLKSYRAAV